MYGVKHQGEIVGWVPNTGNAKVDAEASMELLKAKGLYQPVTKLQSMFRQAYSFCTTSSYLYKKDLTSQPHNYYSVAPFVVNAALAIELYLKTLSEIHGKKLWGHELAKLFDNLPKAAVEELEAEVPAAAAGHNIDTGKSFRDCLHRVNDAFVDWRYLYEKQGTQEIRIPEVIFLMDVVHHACSKHKEVHRE
jgi:HEPN domain-containing protein